MKIVMLLILMLFSQNTQANIFDMSLFTRLIHRTKTQNNIPSRWNQGGCKTLELEKKLKKECHEEGYGKCLTVKRAQKMTILDYDSDTGWVTKDICEVTIKGLSFKKK